MGMKRIFFRLSRRKMVCYGVVVYDRTTQEVLIVETPAGVYGFPKGSLKPNETDRQCALRELSEETGMTVDNLSDQCLWLELSATGRMSVSYYFAEGRKGSKLTWDPEELSEARWVPVSELKNLRTKPGRERIFADVEQYVQNL
jgi:8-oxo-dGTP pyrophosphatase MutT (NUDIX family)